MRLLRLDRGGLGEGHHQRSVAAEARQVRTATMDATLEGCCDESIGQLSIPYRSGTP